MKSVARWWRSLFVVEKPGAVEILLWILIAIVLRTALSSVRESEEVIRSSAAFESHVVAVRPMGWASLLPPDLVLNSTFNRIVAGVTMVSALAWLFKVGIPYSSVSTAVGYGFLLCIRGSRNFTYAHEYMPTEALLIIIALHYSLHGAAIRSLLEDRRYWHSASCPRWVSFLVVLFMATYYGYAGFNKVVSSGWLAFDGLNIQLILVGENEPNAFARPLLNSRMLATILMSATIILEAGALLAFWNRWTRLWWALCLIGMHVGVLLAMKIYFLPCIAVLSWLAVPSWEAIIDAVQKRFAICRSLPGAVGMCARVVNAALWRFPNCDLFGLSASPR